MTLDKLDNIVWHALSTYYSRFNIGNNRVKFFDQNVSPFIACENWDDKDTEVIEATVPDDRHFIVFTAMDVLLPPCFEVIDKTITNVNSSFQPCFRCLANLSF